MAHKQHRSSSRRPHEVSPFEMTRYFGGRGGGDLGRQKAQDDDREAYGFPAQPHSCGYSVRRKQVGVYTAPRLTSTPTTRGR
jgi:hypothetical protein